MLTAARFQIVAAASLALFAAANIGCSASAQDAPSNNDKDGPVESASSEVVSVVRLDEITAAELKTAATERFTAMLKVLVDAHPDINKVSDANIGTFVETRTPLGDTPGAGVSVDVDHETADTIRNLFAFNEVRELSIAKIKSSFPTWLAQQLPAATTASGKVKCTLAAARSVGAACHAAEDAKAISSAAKPRNLDMGKLVSDWQGIFNGGEGADFVRPVKLVGGSPSTSEVKRLAGVIDWCPQRAWGDEAVDAYVDRHPELASHKAGLKGTGIQKRWYWACGGQEWGADGFALLDEHNQLWAFTTYASE
jgi:hypothetical protein